MGASHVAIALSLALAGCGSSDHDDPPDAPFEKFAGTWEQAGYGRIWQFSGNALVRYEYNRFACLRVGDEPLDALNANQTHFQLTGEGNEFLLDGVAGKPWRFQRVAALPAHCQTPLAGEQSALTQFDYFWHTFNDYYAFFSERGLDWQQIYQDYRPRIAAASNDEERIALYGEIITQFGDAHVALSDKQQFEMYGEDPVANRRGLAAETASSPLISTHDEAGYAQLARYSRAHVDSLLLAGSRQQAGQPIDDVPALVWGRLQPDIGYLRVERLVDLNETSDISNVNTALSYVEREIRFIDTQMQALKQDLTGVRAMVIDLRYNGGGFDPLGLRIASHFNTQAKTIGTVHVGVAQTWEQPVTLPARPDAWTLPIVLLTSADTASAAEITAHAFSTLSNTQVVGSATHGIFSDVLDRQLPNGWLAGLSNERFQDNHGITMETRGVQPAIAVNPFASTDILFGSNTLIDHALQWLGSTPLQPVTENELDIVAEQAREQLGIPGLALAIVKGDAVHWVKGYGWADRENAVPTQTNTPFALASISKTMVGTYMMQLAEAGRLDLDTPLDPHSLGFTVASPLADTNPITLRQLSTHSSGIVDDTEGYRCNYYLTEDGSSLLNALLGDMTLCPAPYTDQLTYLRHYLSADGSLYDAAHFIDTPGEQWHYSNVGAALAAQAVENHTGTPLTLGMQQQLFAPLGMDDTGWDKTQLATTPARQYTHWLGGDSAQLLPDYLYSDRYSGGVWASAHDLARYLLAIARGGELEGNRILSQAQAETMLSRQTSADTGALEQGIFWVKNGNFIGHDGSDPGVETLMYYNPVTEVGVVMLANSDSLLRANEDGSISPDQPYYALLRALYRHGLSR